MAAVPQIEEPQAEPVGTGEACPRCANLTLTSAGDCAICGMKPGWSRESEKQRRRLEGLAAEAVDVIADVMRKPGRNSIARLNAARMILDRVGLTSAHEVDLEVNIKRLEGVTLEEV